MKRILFFTVIVVAVLSMIHSVQSVYNLWQKKDIIAQTKKEVQNEQEENKKLTQQLQTVSTSAFVEEEARNKLFMAKPGEKLVFIPASELATTAGATKQPTTHLSNWQQWWRLFF